MLAMKKALEAEGWSVDVLAFDGVMIRRRTDATVTDDLLRHVEAVIPFLDLPDQVYPPGTAWTPALRLASNLGSRSGVLGAPIPTEPSPGFARALGAVTATLHDGASEVARGTAGPGQPILARAQPATRGWIAGALELEPDELRGDDVRHFAVHVGEAPALQVDAASGAFHHQSRHVLGLDAQRRVHRQHRAFIDAGEDGLWRGHVAGGLLVHHRVGGDEHTDHARIHRAGAAKPEAIEVAEAFAENETENFFNGRPRVSLRALWRSSAALAHTRQSAVFQFRQPLMLESGDRLIATIHTAPVNFHQRDYLGEIGRIRISVSPLGSRLPGEALSGEDAAAFSAPLSIPSIIPIPLDLGGGPLHQAAGDRLNAGVLVGVGEGIGEGGQLGHASLPGAEGALQGLQRLQARKPQGADEASGPAQPGVHPLAQKAQMGLLAPCPATEVPWRQWRAAPADRHGPPGPAGHSLAQNVWRLSSRRPPK
jgi:hypothetical protein